MLPSRHAPKAESAVKSHLARRHGYHFVPSENRWCLSKDVTISLSWVECGLCATLAAALRQALTYFAENYSAGYVAGLNVDFKHFVTSVSGREGTLKVLTAAQLLNYRALLGENHLSRLYRASRVMRLWHEQHIIDIPGDVLELLADWKLKGEVKGAAVRTRCPYKGPLTDNEFEATLGALYAALEAGDIELSTFVLAMLFYATGRRPCQLRDLKVKDFVSARAKDGLPVYILRIPRAKQSDRGDDPWRAEFKDVALEPELGEALEAHVAKVKARVSSLLPEITEEMIQETPIFPSWKDIATAGSATKKSLLEAFRSDFFHRTRASISFAVSHCIDRLEIHSERVNGPIHVFPYRLRRTLATRAAREGYGDLVIAELLDQTDTQNVKVYTENVAENVDAISAAVATQLAPTAQAFAGVLVDSEVHARRGNDVTSRVKTSDGMSAGTCGKFGFCGALAPFSCYTCVHFQPLLDGPHEQVLQDLVRENERIQQLTGDKTIASINNRTLLAVAEVVELCKRRKAELAL